MSDRRLTLLQETLLWIVEQNEPASVADCAGHALIDDGRARSVLTTLERRGLLDRTYTGHQRGSNFAYVLTRAGAALAQEPERDPDECDLCGRAGGRHLRTCIVNPERRCQAHHPAPLRAAAGVGTNHEEEQ